MRTVFVLLQPLFCYSLCSSTVFALLQPLLCYSLCFATAFVLLQPLFCHSLCAVTAFCSATAVGLPEPPCRHSPCYGLCSATQALVDIKLEKDKRLREETYRYWNEIVPHGTYDFDRTEHDAEAIESLTKEQLCAFFNKHFARTSPNRRKLSTQIFSGQHELPPAPTEGNITCLDSLEEQISFKRSMFAFPVLSGPKPALAASE